MHNLKEIRKDFSKFEKGLEKRSVKIDFNNLKKLDELNRDLIQKKENLEKDKKNISKSKDESLFKKSKEISTELEKISEQQKNTKTELDNILSSIKFDKARSKSASSFLTNTNLDPVVFVARSKSSMPKFSPSS